MIASDATEWSSNSIFLLFSEWANWATHQFQSRNFVAFLWICQIRIEQRKKLKFKLNTQHKPMVIANANGMPRICYESLDWTVWTLNRNFYVAAARTKVFFLLFNSEYLKWDAPTYVAERELKLLSRRFIIDFDSIRFRIRFDDVILIVV